MEGENIEKERARHERDELSKRDPDIDDEQVGKVGKVGKVGRGMNRWGE